LLANALKMTLIVLIYAVLGVFAGFLGGLLGLGGGIVVVPALYFIFHWQQFASDLDMHLAVGTSLATAAFTAVFSAAAHHRRGAVNWPAVRLLLPGIVVGAVLGAFLAERLASTSLRVFFALFELFVAAQLGFGLQPKPSRTLPAAPVMAATGAGIGGLSAILGIGGGTMTVPFLVWCDMSIRQAVATSAACGVPICIAAAAAHIIAGWQAPGLPAAASGYVYWPAVVLTALTSVFFAPLGARVAHSISMLALRRVFAGVVAIIGLRMLVG
jgi:uncharacterized membrane protein YfcA